MTFNLSNWITFNLAEFYYWMTVYCIMFNLAECSIGVTVLLEYPDIASDVCSLVPLHRNLLAFTQILLYYCRGFLWWPLQLQTDFQLTALNSWGIIGLSFNHKFNCVALTLVGFCFPDSFQTTKKHSYDDCSIYMPSFYRSLPADYPVGVSDIWPFFHEKSINIYWVPT